jgi:hypothetical protein
VHTIPRQRAKNDEIHGAVNEIECGTGHWLIGKRLTYQTPVAAVAFGPAGGPVHAVGM